MNKQDILMVGVGGQGTILASDILGEAALAKGLDVKKTDTLGMAQRGGSVTSHLRIGKKVWSPLISPGEADVLLAFEKLEAARWVNYIKPDGLVIINKLAILPLSISLGTQRYPDDQEIIDSFRQRTSRIHLIDGTKQAGLLGDIRTLNIFMLGFLSHFLSINFDPAIWKQAITKQLPAKILDINIRAFEKGREVASSVSL
ncbi:MAG: indolepyruvate oxidoreductase subunit beta [Chloroflexi bacterium]|nr:indolepyruvate oxidoreductase subunit beta [Chloroflexota bacterium]